MPGRYAHLTPSAVQGALAESLAELRCTLELPEAYPADAEAEAAAVADAAAVDGSDDARPDLTDLPFHTIDPEGSRDLDQALHLERSGEGFVVRYAIADLAAVVRPGGAIDAETRRRGQTLYAPDGSVPLHPLVLSHGASSLLPGERRRAYVWQFTLDAEGAVASTTLTRAWVRSVRQWSYPEAQAAIDDGSAPEEVALLQTVGPLRIALEAARGGASLNSPEEEVVEGEHGYELRRRTPLVVEDWNAQLSLMTGMAAADLMLGARVGILRTLPPAEPDALAEFRRKVALLDRPWPDDIDYGEYLRRLDPADPATPAVLQAAAALFRGAGYAAFDGEPPAQVEQAAIGAPYAHATAPLRRLVDRWSLAICQAAANGREIPDWARASLGELPSIMQESGGLASRLEGGAVDRIEAAVLHARIGDVLDAIVLAETKGGSRVQIADPFVTATVREKADPGSRVRVRVESTRIDTGEVALRLAG
ncbi:RNB domain-containing ribonuclease [Microbacterium sediminis]|uniref:Ribonuclease II n=1 Tax=Microbacterium sediminis TaxID=904291 RepID=A0A1B9NCJ4_9MICO|nr:RNB domain-containing ribonuclease [Microbacterium sediminis]OCG74325.1 ribonuclease II [Microbacterium sediminis]QBR73688.1 RNB domain-containing ribonuclease [Microbacterium sediminis]